MAANLESDRHGFQAPPTLGVTTTIGGDQSKRGNSDYIFVPGPSVSKDHAKIEKLTGEIQPFWITDLGSKDGTFVNNKQLKANEPYLLSSPAEIRIGMENWTFKKDSLGRGTIERGGLTDKRFLGTTTIIGGDQNKKSSIDYIFLANVSIDHAKIEVASLEQEDAYAIFDQSGSGVRTYVNDKILNQGEPYFLNSEDKILIGNVPCTFKQTNPPKPGSTSKPKSPISPLGAFFIGLIVGLVLTSIGSSGILNSNQSTAQNTLTAFCGAVRGGNYQSAYDQMSSSAQRQAPEWQFVFKLEQTFTRQGGLKNCAVVGNVAGNGSTATGTLTYTFGNGRTASYTDLLVNENNVWKISNLKP